MRRARKSNATRNTSEFLSNQRNAYPVLRPLLSDDTPVSSGDHVLRHSPQQSMEAQALNDRRISSPSHFQVPQTQAVFAQPLMSQSPEEQRPHARATPKTNHSDPRSSEEDHPTASSKPAYLGETGILPVFAQEHREIAKSNQASQIFTNTTDIDLPPLELQESFAETYFEYCWPWCPILDKRTLRSRMEDSPSALLINALALLGTRIRPPLVQHAEAAEYYHRAKMLFYTDHESDPIVCLQSIMLFYWWAPRR